MSPANTRGKAGLRAPDAGPPAKGSRSIGSIVSPRQPFSRDPSRARQFEQVGDEVAALGQRGRGLATERASSRGKGLSPRWVMPNPNFQTRDQHTPGAVQERSATRRSGRGRCADTAATGGASSSDRCRRKTRFDSIWSGLRRALSDSGPHRRGTDGPDRRSRRVGLTTTFGLARRRPCHGPFQPQAKLGKGWTEPRQRRRLDGYDVGCVRCARRRRGLLERAAWITSSQRRYRPRHARRESGEDIRRRSELVSVGA
jgi:hypothetical protein